MRLIVFGWIRSRPAASSHVNGRSIVSIFASTFLGETLVTGVGAGDVFILNSLIEWEMVTLVTGPDER